MNAARLHEGETALRIEKVDTPQVQPGAVLVDIQTVFLSPFTASLVEGPGDLLTPPRPFTPGMDAVGTIRSLGSDVTGLEAGQRVYCDCYYQSPKGGAEDFGFIDRREECVKVDTSGIANRLKLFDSENPIEVQY